MQPDMQPTTSNPGTINLAAMQNLSPNWHAIFSKLGLNIVIVWLDTKLPSPIHDHPHIEEALGLELQQVGAGSFDSNYYPGCFDINATGTVWHIFHAYNLGAAMARLKAGLAVRGLLGVAGIFHAEDYNRIVCWYSCTPEEIGQSREV